LEKMERGQKKPWRGKADIVSERNKSGFWVELKEEGRRGWRGGGKSNNDNERWRWVEGVAY
jgi:hypothetical protein